jgi:hypothetical protein
MRDSEIGKTTPGPWKTDGAIIVGYIPQVGGECCSQIIATIVPIEEAEANAALIVKVVNGFEKMQGALAELVELLLDEHLLNRLDDALNAQPPLDPVRLVMLLRARDAARSSLGEVTG